MKKEKHFVQKHLQKHRKKRNIKRRRIVNKLNQRENQSTLISTRLFTPRNIRIVFFLKGTEFLLVNFFVCYPEKEKRIQLNTKHGAVVSLQLIFRMRIPVEFPSICRISVLRSFVPSFENIGQCYCFVSLPSVCECYFTVNQYRILINSTNSAAAASFN